MGVKQKLTAATMHLVQATGEFLPLPKSLRMTADGYEFMRTLTSYQSGQAINAATKLDLFPFLNEAKSLAAIADYLKMTPEGARVLLDAVTAASLINLQTADGIDSYKISKLGRKIFLAKYWNPARAMVDFMDGTWQYWQDLPEVLQNNDGHPLLKVYNPENPMMLNYVEMMTSMLYRPTQELAKQLDLSEVNNIVCGTVGVSAAKAMMEEKPSIDLTVCCLPLLIEHLPKALKQFNYEKEPLEMIKNTGDATTDNWGKVGIYDMIFLVRKFAFFTPDHGIDYLNRSMANIRPGGYVILWEPYADLFDAAPWMKANMQLVDGMLGMPAPLWRKKQVVEFVKQAGYDDVKIVDTAGGTCSFIVARVPHKH